MQRILSQPRIPSQGVRALHFPQPAPRWDERRWEVSTIPTTVAGRLPKPAWLAEPEKLWAPWRLEGAELVEGQQKAALDWIRFEASAGLAIVSDGAPFRKTGRPSCRERECH